MTRLKQKSPEQFIGSSSVGERIAGDVFKRHLAEGALRVVQVNGETQEHNKLGNKEEKTAEVINSGYYGITHINPDFIAREIQDLAITQDNIPDGYFALQQRIAHERGYGNITLTPEAQAEAAATLRHDQVESLEEWAQYLRRDTNGHVYPDWFKVYTWESLKKMGEFDKAKGEFKKRTKTTTAPWPELNAEALAYVYDAVDKNVIQRGAQQGAEPGTTSQELERRLTSGNFARLYAYAIEHAHVGGITPELRAITDGKWVKYDRIVGDYRPNYDMHDGQYDDDTLVDNPTAMRLAGSLRGKETGWCTAGTRTAAHQLTGGDFYVYYTHDSNGQSTMPRIAVRMEQGQVAEVRGISQFQGLESNMADIAAKKLTQLPGGDKYEQRLANTHRVTAIENAMQAGEELTAADIRFLQFSGRIEGFDWNREDPRVRALRRGRDVARDIVDCMQAYGADVVDSIDGEVLAEQMPKMRQYGLAPDLLSTTFDTILTKHHQASHNSDTGRWLDDYDHISAALAAGKTTDWIFGHIDRRILMYADECKQYGQPLAPELIDSILTSSDPEDQAFIASNGLDLVDAGIDVSKLADAYDRLSLWVKADHRWDYEYVMKQAGREIEDLDAIDQLNKPLPRRRLKLPKR